MSSATPLRILTLLTSSFLLAAAGCAGTAPHSDHIAHLHDPGIREPQNPEENTVLESGARLSAGESETSGDLRITVTETYTAASGIPCKILTLHHEPQRHQRDRTICQFADRWGFAPDVFP